MKKLFLTLVLCLFSANCYAVDIINGGSVTFYATCSVAKPVNYLAAKPRVDIFLKAYRASTIKKNLKQIRLCGSLTLWGQKWAAGTYDLEKKIIYVLADENPEQEYVLHHEFSSILLKRSSRWCSIEKQFKENSKDHYGNVITTDWMEESARHFRKGFIVPYAQTCFENDFNMIASYYKTSFLKKRMGRMLKYPLISKKYNIIKRFYKNL